MSKQIAERLVEKMYERHDEDNDGRLSKFEFTRTVNGITQAIRGEKCIRDDIETLFDLINLNGDSSISKDEFIILIEKIIDILQTQDKKLYKKLANIAS